MRVVAQVEQSFGVFLQDAAGVGQHAFARGAVEQRLADFFFQLADGWLTADWVRSSFSAARENRPSRATVRNTSSWDSSISCLLKQNCKLSLAYLIDVSIH